MGTTAGTRSTLGSAREGESDVRDMDRDEQYDLLTAALIGVAVGAGTALLISALVPEPPRGVERAMRRGRKLAARGGKLASRGSRAALAAPEAAREQLGAYLESAREAIADTVEAELKDLRRSIRRRRRRLGL